ncbi:MAG: hypothetical protein ACKVOO_05150 [Burkholderiaceae bacterium]
MISLLKQWFLPLAEVMDVNLFTSPHLIGAQINGNGLKTTLRTFLGIVAK